MVHVIFDPESVSIDDFFQRGGGAYYYGSPYQRGYGYHRGAGIGNLFKSFWRFILPMAKMGGSEALVTGAKILNNIAQGVEVKDAVKSESKEGAKRLIKHISDKYPVQNMRGSGLRKRKKKKPLGKSAFRTSKKIKTYGLF